MVVYVVEPAICGLRLLHPVSHTAEKLCRTARQDSQQAVSPSMPQPAVQVAVTLSSAVVKAAVSHVDCSAVTSSRWMAT